MLTALCTTTRKRYQRRTLMERPANREFLRVENLNQLIYGSDVTCMEQLRMDRHTFTMLCSMLRTIGKLKDSKYVDVEEMVALFLHILAHHSFAYKEYYSKNRNQSLRTPQMRDGNGLSRRNGLTVPHGYYYLVDAGYTNGKGFLAPYRGQRYHLNDWREGHMPTTHEEFFNMKHSAARNVIERCFGLLKLRWAILRSPCFYPIKTQCKIILACCLIHNLIKREMSVDPLEQELDVQDHQVVGKVKCDNGFKPGAFLQVEKMLEEKLPNSGIKASPHIDSRGHKDANGLRLKPFPHFDDLNLVFGKDRANGKGAMLAADILEELDQVEASNDIGVNDLEAEVDASHTNTVASTPSRMECSLQSRRKRARNDDTALINVMTKTCNALESLVGNFNQQTEKENRVVGELEKLPNLNRLDILKLSQIIMSDPMKVKLLFNLDEDLKVE
ncbi:hypothetical protein CK203_093473 [Vitis vinifera]|uniref:Uncharacterized protein n=1 Tax=Vitis vinifera TaxID=29760 RepID=A0A438BNH2_VITVI|nr:hypothetical protein CK203_093473 [Vitis vinifera]